MNLQEILSGAPRDRTTLWKAYTFAVFVTVATLCFRLALDSLFGGHPTLIIFILPILLSGFVGGLGAGLLATAISYLASFCLLPPIHSFHPVTVPDHWPQLFIVLLGIVISVLNETAIRRARHQAKIAFKLSEVALVKAETIQNAVCNCSSFSCVGTDATGIIQYFNAGAEHMFGYKTSEVIGQMAVTRLLDQDEVKARAQALSMECNKPIASNFEAIAYKASQEINDNYDVTKVRKDGSRFPASVSVTALRDANFGILGFLLIATDNTLRQRVEIEREKTAAELQNTNVKLELARAAAEKANQG